MMKAQVDGQKAPLSSSPCTTPLCFALSAAVRVCSLAAGCSGSMLTKRCLFPGLQSSSGKLGSRGETNKKAPVSRAEAALWHICLFLTTGLHSSLRREMTERVFFRNRASGKQNHCCFKLCIFFQCKCHFQSLLACGGSSLHPTAPLFSLSCLNSKLFVLCCCINTFWVKPKKTASSNRQITQYTSRILQPESLTLEIMYSCWRAGWNKFNYGSCEDYVPADRSDIWDFASPSTTSLLRGF